MELLFGGVRGSEPVCGAGYEVYGGDTTSVLVTGQDGQRVIIDGGTGISNLSPHLGASGDLLLLFTHYHLDHVCGLPSFAPLYDANCRLTVVGPVLPGGHGVRQTSTTLVNAPFWPVPLKQLAADLTFADFTPGGEPLRRGGLEITAQTVGHPGGCVAWRIDEPATKTVLIFATDMEWSKMPLPDQEAFIGFCRQPSPADLLVMDGHYTGDEYDAHAGWGHSTVDEVLHLGETVGAGRVLVTHHAPERDDDALDELAGRLVADGRDVGLARQGLVVSLDSKTRWVPPNSADI